MLIINRAWLAHCHIRACVGMFDREIGFVFWGRGSLAFIQKLAATVFQKVQSVADNDSTLYSHFINL